MPIRLEGPKYSLIFKVVVVGSVHTLALLVHCTDNANLEKVGNFAGHSELRPKSHARLASPFSSRHNLLRDKGQADCVQFH